MTSVTSSDFPLLVRAVGSGERPVLRGEVTRGYGLAARNLAHVTPLIAARTGLARVYPGTLNVRLPEPYIVAPDALVTAEEYDGREWLKLQRCVVHHGTRSLRGIRAVLVRPHMHETVPGWAHGPSHAELLSAVRLRRALALYDGAPVRIELGGGWAWWGWAGDGRAHLLKAEGRRRLQRQLGRDVWPG